MTFYLLIVITSTHSKGNLSDFNFDLCRLMMTPPKTRLDRNSKGMALCIILCPFRFCLGSCIKKFAKNAVTLTAQKFTVYFTMVSLSWKHSHWGLICYFLTSIPVTFIGKSLPPLVVVKHVFIFLSTL